jgi:hypothetical protein
VIYEVIPAHRAALVAYRRNRITQNHSNSDTTRGNLSGLDMNLLDYEFELEEDSGKFKCLLCSPHLHFILYTHLHPEGLD